MIRRRTHRLVAWVDEQTYNTVRNYCQYNNADPAEYVGELINRGFRDRNEEYREKLFEKIGENKELNKLLDEYKNILVHSEAIGYMNEKKYDKLMIVKRNDYKDTYAAMELRDMLVFMGIDSWGEFTEILLDAIKNGDIWIEGGKVVRRKSSLKAQRIQVRAGLRKHINPKLGEEGEE